MAATLWLVATPIGNLGDLQPRAIEVLAAADLVCCEDTRRTGLLLHHAGIKAKRMVVCNEHTEYDLIDQVLSVLDNGGNVAVVSDAGSPGVSDPGERLVRAVVDSPHAVSAVPGPSAAIMAATISGLDTSRFVFDGFLPRKGRERSARLADVAAECRTTVLYEAPHRALKTLADLADVCGPDRMVVVTRELTKLHEEVIRGTLGTVDIGEPRGEYVFVVEGAPVDNTPLTEDDIRALLTTAIESGLSKRDAAARVAAETGQPKRDIYQLTLD
ncbi:MAG: 16S rRNA (cytidine(1402)-2'-O)-methyltransferase [Ilumatobacter sp.]|jgi:16S rRNA (cytidine1402-2'-O)-methyltransferase|nr:16S rRNA (cytidine(1402)-2'-O)-methyltransferase [Ilumatobacter sp.]